MGPQNLIGGRMLNSEKVLLVLVSGVHFWVSFLSSLEICCLPLFTRYYAKLEHHGKKYKNCFYFKLCSSFSTSDPCDFSMNGSDIIADSTPFKFCGWDPEKIVKQLNYSFVLLYLDRK